jgi:hypothetical protein
VLEGEHRLEAIRQTVRAVLRTDDEDPGSAARRDPALLGCNGSRSRTASFCSQIAMQELL